MLKAKGAENFGIHAFLASNTVTNDYYPKLARILFKLAVRLERETGAHVAFINLSGGVGIPYLPEQQANDIHAIGEGVHAPTTRFWSPPAWAMWRSAPRWVAL